MDALGCALLPASCALCGSPLPQLSTVPICNACWAEFPLQTDPLCARCGDTLAEPLMGPAGFALCRTCRMAPPPFVRAVAYGPYQGRMKEAIHALKYDHLHPAARTLGQMLAEAIAQLAPEAPLEMLVIPVPLHRSKHAERGFNQARSLAVQALASLRKTHPQWRLTLAANTLMRLRSTKSQAGLTFRQRRLNVRGAFTVSNPASVARKHVLLIDDILTTGATARAAAQALARAGAASVWVATLARACSTIKSRGGFAASFREAEELPGTMPVRKVQQASIHSSQDQSSF
ncbi:MAG: phosphoribosyltransferase family protein [Terracidiphilus sp.]|nr:phosphoribosyltransferase family protein [Terracidiphilus sp.]